MSGESAGIRVQAEATDTRHKPAADPGGELLSRRMYVAMRLGEISAQVDEMVAAREKLTAELKKSPGESTAGNRELRQKRAYIAQRLVILRKEQADLKDEKNSLR